MIEIVGHPCGEELTERHGAELRVPAATIKISIGQAESFQLAKVVLAQRRKLVEQAGQRSSLRRLELRKAIELVNCD